MEIVFRGLIDILRAKQSVKDLANAGIKCAGFPLGAFFYWKPEKNVITGQGKTLPYQLHICDESLNLEKLRNVTSSYLNAMSANNMELVIADMPWLPSKDDFSDDCLMRLLDVHTLCIELAAENRVGYMNAGYIDSSNFGKDVSVIKAINLKYYQKLGVVAKEKNIKLLFGNQCRDIGGHFVRGPLSDGVEASEFIDDLNSKLNAEVFGYNLDVVNATVCGLDIQQLIEALGTRIKAVTIGDSDGRGNMRRIPFSMRDNNQHVTDWLGLIRGLRSIDFDGCMVFDVWDSVNSFSPLLRPSVLTLAKESADYLAWQVSLEHSLKTNKKLVLFGAGNMCRNYMKNYGERYTPLFTCDNNPEKWGQYFEGLEIKNPAELANLPDDVCVVICNVYYREIEAQLKSLGVSNISFFNDEYMPSYYFDRLERK